MIRLLYAMLLFAASCSAAVPPSEPQLCLTGTLSRSEWDATVSAIRPVMSRFGLTNNGSYHFMTVWDKRDDVGWQAELIFDYTEGAQSTLALFVYEPSLSEIVPALESALIGHPGLHAWARCSPEMGASLPRTNRRMRTSNDAH